MSEEIKERTKSIKDFLKSKEEYLEYILLGIIIWFGYKVRTLNLHLLKDQITGKFIMADPDATAFLRYTKYIIEHGHMMTNDILRYHPIGFNPNPEFTFLSHVMAKLYTIMHAFSNIVTVEYAAVIYPAIAFIIGIIFFYLIVKELTDKKTAILATGILTILPAYLFRTMAGVSDKEALGIMFFFIATYTFIQSWKQKTPIKAILFGILTGLATAAMGMAWGGINFLFLIFGAFILIEIALDKFTEFDFYTYTAWIITLFVTFQFIYPYTKFQIMNMSTTVMGQAILFAFVAGLIKFIIHKYDIAHIRKFTETKLPPGLFSIGIAILFGIGVLSIWHGPQIILQKLQQFYILFHNIPTSRWILTVAESHQPYVVDWFGQFTKKFLYIFLAGSIILFYNMVKPIKEHKWHLTGLFTLFLLAFIGSRYQASGIFNGESNLAHLLYGGSLALLILGSIMYYFYCYKNKPEIFQEILKINKTYTFLFVWIIISLAGARTAIRMLFFFAPVVAIMGAYTFTTILEWAKTQKKWVKIGTSAITLIILFITIGGFTEVVIAQGQSIGPGYNIQWQKAMDWTQKNTPEDAVFAHWWDYGYYVQTGGNRATISDGGNARGAINYFTGRYLLTGQNYEDALDFLYANEVTNVLMVSEEVGKYGAFSTIGSDVNYDRRSWIPTFNLDVTKTIETRDSVIYNYFGGWNTDEDFTYQGKFYPAGETGIGAIFLKATVTQDTTGNTAITIKEPPTAATFYQNQRTDIPIKCVYLNGQEMTFDVKEGHQGCFYIMPVVASNTQMNPIGAAFYLSPRVYKSRFTRLYLFGEETNNFKLVYSDQNEVPIAIYQGTFIGPLKIWEITYPKDIKDIPMYREPELPDPRVNEV